MNISLPFVICGGFFILIFLVLGLVLLFGNMRARKRADASQSWPSTNGTILQTDIKTSYSHDDDGNISRTSYIPHVEYSYAVGGVTYQSKKIAFGSKQMFSTHQEAASTLSPYPEGAQVTVFYNPEKYDDAVLERAAPKSKIGMILGIIFLAIGGCGLLTGAIVLVVSLLRG